MNILLTDLKFNVTELSKGDNKVIVSYSGKSDVADIILDLEIQAEPNVNFKNDATLVSHIRIANKFTNEISTQSELVIINVLQKLATLTPVIFNLFAQKGTPDQQKRRETIFF